MDAAVTKNVKISQVLRHTFFSFFFISQPLDSHLILLLNYFFLFLNYTSEYAHLIGFKPSY